MVALRSPIPDFQLANPLYRGAQVVFYLASATGQITSTLAELYGEPTGSLRVTNPQTLDGDGKFARPVYIDAAVIGVIVGANVESHSTGTIYPQGVYRGIFTRGRRYTYGDLVIGPDGNNLYVASQDFVAAASIQTDVIAQRLVFIIGMALLTADKLAAQAAATAAAASQKSAEDWAKIAQQSAGSVDAQTIAARFLALEQRADVLESVDYEAERIALGIAYQGSR